MSKKKIIKDLGYENKKKEKTLLPFKNKNKSDPAMVHLLKKYLKQRSEAEKK